MGAQGRGESVWLTWFFAITARKFAALVGGHAAGQLTLAADHCTRAAEDAWDGAWYRRGYYDDGRPLGSAGNDECRIDAIAQAFAAPSTRTPTAVYRAHERGGAALDREHNVVRLFDPPITRRTPETGYVRSYGAGLRENGGQYTHGALWLAMALLRTGRTAEGAEILHAVLPTAHDPARYEGEPYVLAADIAGGDTAGAAGWTWYTGAAGGTCASRRKICWGCTCAAACSTPSRTCRPAGRRYHALARQGGAAAHHPPAARRRDRGQCAPTTAAASAKSARKPYSQDR